MSHANLRADLKYQWERFSKFSAYDPIAPVATRWSLHKIQPWIWGYVYFNKVVAWFSGYLVSQWKHVTNLKERRPGSYRMVHTSMCQSHSQQHFRSCMVPGKPFPHLCFSLWLLVVVCVYWHCLHFAFLCFRLLQPIYSPTMYENAQVKSYVEVHVNGRWWAFVGTQGRIYIWETDKGSHDART
jgi:hypothetical protein